MRGEWVHAWEKTMEIHSITESDEHYFIFTTDGLCLCQRKFPFQTTDESMSANEEIMCALAKKIMVIKAGVWGVSQSFLFALCLYPLILEMCRN